jgi:hypothetical protein
LEVIFSPPEEPTVPPPIKGTDVNFCKNPRCANFGVTPNITKYGRRQKAIEAGKDGKTPALRLGLTSTNYTPEDILYFE